MGNSEPKKKLVGPWRSLQVVIWLVGLYILASHSWWWPGILILVAISVLYEGIVQRLAPYAFEAQTPDEAMKPRAEMPPEPMQSMSAVHVQEHRIDLLPQICPSCNGPIRGHEVRWTGPQSANCPYCGTNLPMNKT